MTKKTTEQEMNTEDNNVPAQVCPLQQHVRAFSHPYDNEGDLYYDGGSIATTLSKAGSRGASVKGPIIAMFNAVHSGNQCPFWQGKLPNDESMADALHLGTARIWSSDGKIDQAKIDAFFEACTTDVPTVGDVVMQDDVMKYLKKCTAEFPEQEDTGRNSKGLMASKMVQTTAATKAWAELFNTYQAGELNGQAYLTADSLKLFFENTKEFVEKFEKDPKSSARPKISVY